MNFLLPQRYPSKPMATGLALWLGWIGLHHFYLRGVRDPWAWIHVGMGGWVLIAVWRWVNFGQFDVMANVFTIVSGFYLAAVMLQVLLIGLKQSAEWQLRYGEQADGKSNALLVVLLILALMFGTVTFFFSLSLLIQRSFEVWF